MRTLDAVHPPSNGNAASRRCAFCGKTLTGNQRRFCGDEHRSQADMNSRQSLSRVKKILERRGLLPKCDSTVPALENHLESQPSTPAARREYNDAKLHVLDNFICAKGASEFEVRKFVRTEAEVLRISLEMDGSRHPEDRLHHTRALELLRDAGTEEPNQENMGRLIEYAWGIVAFYFETGDRLNFAKNLQILANGYRTIGKESKAKQFTGHAWHILRQHYSRSTNLDVLTIAHKSAMWHLRLWADYLERWKTEYSIQQIIGFAETVNTPGIWIETHRELAGYFGATQHDEDKAREMLDEIEKVRSTVSSLPPYGVTTFLRPKIESMLHSGSRSDEAEGIHTINTDYVSAYKNDRHLYFYRTLKQWSDKYGLGLQIDPPEFGSIMMMYMPRGVPKQ